MINHYERLLAITNDSHLLAIVNHEHVVFFETIYIYICLPLTIIHLHRTFIDVCSPQWAMPLASLTRPGPGCVQMRPKSSSCGAGSVNLNHDSW